MADTAVAITAGTGTNIDTRTEGTNGNHRQVVVLGDPATNAGVAPVDATNGLSVSVTNASLAVTSAAGLGSKGLSATFATMTRPANTTPYSASDSISDNATAGSVTALVSGNFSDTADAPVFITHIEIKSTDTGLNGKTLRARVFNADPTASSGVGAGDNATYSNKQAGLVATFIGTMQSGISDGAAGTLVPANGLPGIVALPVSGARTFYIQYEAVEAFTPSANSTTIIGKMFGVQLKAS